MKRFASVFGVLLCAFISFVAALYLFFPMDTALELLWRKGMLAAAEKGVTLETAFVGVDDYFPLRIVFRNVRVAAPVASAEAGMLTVRPLFVESILSMSPTAEIRLENFSLGIPLPGQPPIAFSTFYSKSSVRASAIHLSGIQTTGDLVIVGDMTVNPATAKLDEADLHISGERASLLEFAKTMLPLQKDASGAWTLKRKGGENK